MFFDMYDVGFWTTCCQVFLAMGRNQDHDDWKRPLEDMGIASVQRFYSAPSRSVLNALVYITDAGTLIMFDGCRRNDMARDVCYAYAMGPLDPPAFGESSAYNAITLRTLQNMLPVGQRLVDPILFVGYSVGACSATLAAGAIAGSGLRYSASAICFSPPRMAASDYGRRVPAHPLFRIHCDMDPVSALPTWTNEAAAAEANADPALGVACNKFTHPGRGISMNEDGTFSLLGVGERPNVPANLTGSLFSWATGILLDQLNPHSMQAMLTRLSKLEVYNRTHRPAPVFSGNRLPFSDDVAIPANQPPIVPPPVGDGGGFIGPHSTRAIAATILPPEMVPVGLVGKLSNQPPYYAQKIFGKWYVMYNAVAMYAAISRRGARKRAADLNRFVDSFDNSNYHDRETSLNSFELELDP